MLLFLSISNKIFMSELYNMHSVNHTDSFLFGGRRGHRAQDGGRKGEESTLDVKDFHFPPKHKCPPLCLHYSGLPLSLSIPLSLWPTIPPSSSLPPPIPLMLYLSFSLYTWLALLMAQGQELWELKRLDGRVSFGVWSMCVWMLICT